MMILYVFFWNCIEYRRMCYDLHAPSIQLPQRLRLPTERNAGMVMKGASHSMYSNVQLDQKQVFDTVPENNFL
jgi:hypothetical protein